MNARSFCAAACAAFVAGAIAAPALAYALRYEIGELIVRSLVLWFAQAMAG